MSEKKDPPSRIRAPYLLGALQLLRDIRLSLPPSPVSCPFYFPTMQKHWKMGCAECRHDEQHDNMPSPPPSAPQYDPPRDNPPCDNDVSAALRNPASILSSLRQLRMEYERCL